MGCGASVNTGCSSPKRYDDSESLPTVPDYRRSSSVISAGSIIELESFEENQRKKWENMVVENKLPSSARSFFTVSNSTDFADRFNSIWPSFFDDCFETCMYALSGAIIASTDLVNRKAFIWQGIPCLCVMDMILLSLQDDGLNINSKIITQLDVDPASLMVYMELIALKNKVSSSYFSHMETATLRRIVISDASKRADDLDLWMQALDDVIYRTTSVCSQSSDDEDLSYSSTSTGQEGRRQLLLQIASQCQDIVQKLESVRFRNEVAKVLIRVDEARKAPDMKQPMYERKTSDCRKCHDNLPSMIPHGFGNDMFCGTRFRWFRGKLLGQGAFGTVFSAWDVDGNDGKGQVVAVKEVELMGSRAGKVEREISIMSALSHPSIVTLLGSERTDTTLFILMEYAHGGSLADLAKASKGLEETVAREYTAQLLLGLEYLHNNGILHRDIKGANCLLFPAMDNEITSAKGVESLKMIAKLADFGASRMFDVHFGHDLHTDSTGWYKEPSSGRDPAGTINWMAPEIVLDKHAGRSADIWSLGMTVVELMTGKMPWEGLNTMAVLMKIAKSEDLPELPPGLSETGRSFILSCLQREASRRPKVRRRRGRRRLLELTCPWQARRLISHRWVRMHTFESKKSIPRRGTDTLLEGLLQDSMVS
uniref:Protein kinase domain-containing protein n=1 Tax=Guillardia theta TaxID=55529 RepID=A0A7S4U6E1_GUITH|mmetsp:Transcript_4319/g.15784  ORF Transcript_4319/g.15784 Transcript_4319/m.15784 type:complete len:654 (+) Transcript_4319:493-2454(+)